MLHISSSKHFTNLMMCKLRARVSFHLPKTVAASGVKPDDGCFTASQQHTTASGKCLNWLKWEQATLGRQNSSFGQDRGTENSCVGTYGDIFCDYNQLVINLLAIPTDRAFFRETWRMNLTWLEIWYELSSMPLGSLPPLKVLAGSSLCALFFDLRSNRIK